MNIKPEIQSLFEKAKLLKEGEVLHTTFGADRYYLIEKLEDRFTITAHKNKYSFQREGKIEGGATFKDATELNNIIFGIGVEWYAKNHFTGNIIHFDNWINFVNAFKVKILEFTDNGHVTQNWYFYKEKNLDMSN